MFGYFLRMKFKTFMYSAILLTCLILLIYQEKLVETWTFQSTEGLPKIIWWTPFTLRNEFEILTCGEYKCAITDNRSYRSHQISAFLFYGSNFVPYDLPLPRTKADIWGIIHEESPKNLALFLHDDALGLFNFSSTFSRHSDLPLTLQYLPSLIDIVDMKYFLVTENKNKLLDKLSPILYIQSDCETPLERDAYVNELMKYVPIDSYGKCLNNKKLPEKFTVNPLHNLYAEEFMHFVAQYKFVIAFENSVCEDYITEKLWRPLIAGSVPIYMGSPSVQDWLPNKDTSAILANQFKSPKHLAEYIKKLNTNDHLYENYLQHKLSDIFKITNQKLIQSASSREWSIDSGLNYFNSFECLICRNIYKNTTNNFASKKYYSCPEPISPLSGAKNYSNWWNDHWKEGKCQARVLRRFVNEKALRNFTKDLYESEVRKAMIEKIC